MISKLKATGLLWPTFFAIPALLVLIGLGNWQWQRMHWKAGLLRDLEAARSAAPVPLRDVVPLLSTTAPYTDIEAQRFRRVTARGIFEHAQEMHVWAPAKTPAWSVITPLRLAAGDTGVGEAAMRPSHILVVRGIVPDALKDARRRSAGQVEGIQTITGRLRIDQPNTWANAPNIEKNQWFSRDLARMQAHLAQKLGAGVTLAPIFLEAEQQSGGPQAPKPDLKALSLANRHLEYALTWWGLAATLLGVFAVFAYGRIKAADK